jgi:phosphoglycerate dehydrogenase-like enzyme
MTCVSYYSKHIPRLLQQKAEHRWEKFCMTEIRGATMGIVGYGDIGTACARLAKAYGMNVIGLRRRPEISKDDPLLDKVEATPLIDLLNCGCRCTAWLS